ncbi:MAG: glucoamylase family protein [Desulfitobacteriaceae bacterium]|nr:glucoamylase family protein [Desulfitobacteriaceae bacterium]MDD4400400.1 glucoamylase family protein [Desulfitobacteriaceae bacterium]
MLEQDILSIDELKQRARNLALENVAVYQKRGKTPFRNLKKSINQLAAYNRELLKAENAGFYILPAMEWLMDHIDFLKEQNLYVQKHLSTAYYKRLPKLDTESSRTRTSVLLKNFLQNIGGQANITLLLEYLQAYQEVAPLTIGELWAIPLLLRVSLMEEICDLFEEFYKRHEVRIQAEGLLLQWEPHLSDQDKLYKVMDKTTSRIKSFPPVLVVYLIGRIRDYGVEGIPIRQWLERKTGMQTEDIEKIVGHEHRLQALYRLAAGNLIGSLRDVSRWTWAEHFESLNVVEKILRQDPVGIYPLMDFNSRDQLRHAVERLAKEIKVQETLIAQTAVSLASKSLTANGDEKAPAAHVGYYLYDEGENELRDALKARRKEKGQPMYWFKKNPNLSFFSILVLMTLGAFILFWKIIGGFWSLNIWEALVFSLALSVPASEWGLIIVNAFIFRCIPPQPLLRLEYKQGVAPDATTMIIVPTFLSSEDEVAELMHNLEVYHLANQDPQIHFAILGDFRDADEETLPADEEILKIAQKYLADLNIKYPCKEGSTFYLLMRKRQWNPCEGVWMGWERKRGKITEFNSLLLGNKETSFTHVFGDSSKFSQVRYIITLDSDTELPRDAAKHLIGTMAHPLNIPLLNTEETRVIRGYGLLQPRILVKHHDLYRSRLALLFAGSTGIDPYTFAVSDPYQDLFGRGIFTGKGIYDLTIFDKLLSDRFADNTVLSHDLLEGSFLRAGLISDVVFFDGFPANYYSYLKRMHRWIRGDWQLLRWLFPYVRNRSGIRLRVGLPLITRWQMFDNLRRSLLNPVLLILLSLGLLNYPGLPGRSLGWITVALATLSMPLVIHFLNSFRQRLMLRWRWRDVLGIIGQIIVTVWLLPYQSMFILDAIIRALYRLVISKKHLLEWVTAADIDRQTPKTIKAFVVHLSRGSVFGILLLGGVFLSQDTIKLSLVIGLIWLSGPFLAYWLSLPQPMVKRKVIASEDHKYLRALAYDIWRFFETVVTAEDNWLPPDNLQLDPPRGIAHRTSPTNMGLLLATTLAARDFGYLTTTEMLERIENTLHTLTKLPRWNGHFYNWYETRTLEVLLPRYVSTVDSGNMVSYLIAVKQGIKEWQNNPLVDSSTVLGMLDRINEQEKNTLSLELRKWKEQLENLVTARKVSLPGWYKLLREAEVGKFPELIKQRIETALEELKELLPALVLVDQLDDPHRQLWEDAQTLQDILNLSTYHLQITQTFSGDLALLWKDSLEKGITNIRGFLARAEEMQNVVERLITEPDFRPLYDDKIRLMAIGYNVTSMQLDNSHYDLMASEARQTSFVGIALGQLPLEHWFALGRTLIQAGKSTTALLSWTGTMFEYLMPLLLLKNYRDTLWDQTYKVVVKEHISYARKLGLPWGISESGYYAFDLQTNYQYQAFGVPHLGLKRVSGQDRVIAPYATVLAALVDHRASLKNLKVLEEFRVRGDYGFYEALDFTTERIPGDFVNIRVKSYMAHHQGMSFVAIGNLLLDSSLNRRFHADPRIQATELLLQEKIPRSPVVLNRRNWSKLTLPSIREEAEFAQHFWHENTLIPEARIVSNGRYVVMLTTSGGGFSRCGDLTLSRWREDPANDNCGSFFYIRDVAEDKLWSATYQPCQVWAADGKMSFNLEKITYTRTHGEILTMTEITVSPEWDAEIRRITLTNLGQESRLLEVTSYFEVVLASYASDITHPAFNKLFVHTDFSVWPEALLAQRRGRTPDERYPVLAHAMSIEGKAVGPLEYETDRACFLGRGHSYACPQAVVNNQRLSGTIGAVLDPILSLRRKVEIPPGGSVRITYITGIADTKKQVLDMVQSLSSSHQVERTFNLAWTRSRIVLRFLNLTAQQADIYQWMVSRIFYYNPLEVSRRQSILQNSKGQSELWKYGVSGDIPIVIIHISKLENLDFVKSVLLAHEYWREKGLAVDLVIFNDFIGSYEQPLSEALRHLVLASSDRDLLDRSGGVFIISTNVMPVEDQTLFKAVAKLDLDAESGSLVKQLEAPTAESKLPAQLIPQTFALNIRRQSPVIFAENLEFFNGYGGFVYGGLEYTIRLRKKRLPPVPWSNILANSVFGSQISESGSGYTWAENSRENKLTPWNNDPVLDISGEACYLRDEESGEYWSLTSFPIQEEEAYDVNHGIGYSRFRHISHGIIQEGTVFVPLKEPVKVWRISLRNLDKVARQVSLTYYVEWVLGVQRETNAPYIVTEIDEDSGVLLARNNYQEVFPDREAFLYVQTVGEKSEQTWTGDRLEFLGRYGTLQKPAALSRRSLANSTGVMFNSCGAMQVKLTLEPQDAKQILVLLGQGRSREEINSLTLRYTQLPEVDKALSEVVDFWSGLINRVQVVTPDRSMDLLLNGWLVYQTLSCRLWARSAFYQAGGAFGFRDQLQDVLALLHVCPEMVKKQILLHAAHQYLEGDVMHWWHDETKHGIRTKFSDDLLWLPYAVIRYLEHTRDEGILDQEVNFLADLPLKPEEDERYSEIKVSEEKGSLFEHCLRAIERSLHFGKHGLPLMGTGDWNDGMNRVGREGKGESVWLGWFLYTILEGFAEICERRQENDLAGRYRQTAKTLAFNLNEKAWDGQWYRRAYFDNGKPLGSIQNQECQVDAIAQAWAAISGAAPGERALKAMQAVDRELVSYNYSLLSLLSPPFKNTEPSPGYIQGYPEGIRENGGQYTHGAIWCIIAWAKLGEGEKAWELFRMINPINHALTPRDIQRYKVEPYVMAADVYTNQLSMGRGGWTWYTGAASWMYQAGLEWILGIQRRGERLYLKPCIPKNWDKYSLTYKYEQTTYRLVVQNPQHKNTGGVRLELDGCQLTLGPEPYIDLIDDQKDHQVKLTL